MDDKDRRIAELERQVYDLKATIERQERQIDGQARLVRELMEGCGVVMDENARLRAERRPPGGRPPLDYDVRDRIRLELRRGTPVELITRQCGVSRATVYRVSKVMETDEDGGDWTASG